MFVLIVVSVDLYRTLLILVHGRFVVDRATELIARINGCKIIVQNADSIHHVIADGQRFVWRLFHGYIETSEDALVVLSRR